MISKINMDINKYQYNCGPLVFFFAFFFGAEVNEGLVFPLRYLNKNLIFHDCGHF